MYLFTFLIPSSTLAHKSNQLSQNLWSKQIEGIP